MGGNYQKILGELCFLFYSGQNLVGIMLARVNLFTHVF
jgi:hypothetical protein